MVLKRIALALFLCALMPLSANAADKLMMATTTSTQDTGLLEYLQPYFKKDTGIDLAWVSVGTGSLPKIAMPMFCWCMPRRPKRNLSKPATALTAARSCTTTLS